MKKIILALALSAATFAAPAATFWYQGTLMGTVCRNGPYWTNYPSAHAQPVGSQCPVRNNSGAIIGFGVVTDE